jgi:tRNA/tmRNA/rRNA uracil-C5-methylase (TrmA/RlmC/RlmD family)
LKVQSKQLFFYDVFTKKNFTLSILYFCPVCNIVIYGITNTDFFAADVGKFLKFNPQYQGRIDTIILDPPRAGIAPKTLKKVIELDTKKIVYISCNPSTQARDASTLSDAGFKLEKYCV